MNSFSTRAVGLLLGAPGPQRWRITQSLIGLGGYLALALLLWLGSAGEGALLERARVLPPVLAMCTAGLSGYLLMRCRLNRRLAACCGCEPSLTLVQSLIGVALVLWVYTVTGPARGAVLALLVVVVMFSMFALGRRQAVLLALLALAMLAAVMGVMTRAQPARFPSALEVLHLGVTALVLACVTMLSIRLVHLRQRLRDQRTALSRALERLSELATRDELTGLPNRRAMGEMLLVETARHARLGAPLSLALIDIDHFKAINDHHGHAVGDAVLRGFAQRMEAELRGADVLARWGGEEFLLLLPGTDALQALQAVERLREGLRRQPFDAVAPGLRVTFSAGVGGCLGQGDIDSALERADRALYRAKAAGRDRIEPA
ncbi:MAG: hypothetical protein RLZZ592_2737 [Pseudomonadota bacterium]